MQRPTAPPERKSVSPMLPHHRVSQARDEEGVENQEPQFPRMPKEFKAVSRPDQKAQCLEHFEKGINTSRDFCRGMAALMADLASGTIDPKTGNAICNAGAKMLQAVQLQMKHGQRKGNEEPVLKLT